MAGGQRNVKSTRMPSYQVHTEARGAHWIAWITADSSGKPHESVILVARTQEEAAARIRDWAARASN
jgi:hypothetical protein